jgi:hypothetical protein
MIHLAKEGIGDASLSVVILGLDPRIHSERFPLAVVVDEY